MGISTLKKYAFIREMGLRWRRWRSSHSYICGKGNKVICDGIRIGSKIQINGNNNIVEIKDDAVLRDCLIKIQGNDCKIMIDRNCFIADAELWIEDNGCMISIGENTFVGHHSHFACTEDNRSITIGADSLISSYVQIRTGDSHSIIDMDGNRINTASDVTIGHHCWLGQGAKILKGTYINNDSIVATGAIVHGQFGANCLIAGVPAKVIKSGITWKSERL